MHILTFIRAETLYSVLLHKDLLIIGLGHILLLMNLGLLFCFTPSKVSVFSCFLTLNFNFLLPASLNVLTH